MHVLKIEAMAEKSYLVLKKKGNNRAEKCKYAALKLIRKHLIL